MDAGDGLEGALSALAGSLPRGAGFEWEAGEDGLHVAMLTVPSASRGCGTAFLARVLGECDRRGVPVSLDADPTDEPGDPSAFHLARWYRRFGFVLTGVTPEGWLSMHRTPRPWRGEGAILRDYEAARLHHDLAREAFDGAVARLVEEGLPLPGRGVALTP